MVWGASILSAWKRVWEGESFWEHLQSISQLSDPWYLQHLLLFRYFPMLQLSISTPHHRLLLAHFIKKKVFLIFMVLIFMPHRLQTRHQIGHFLNTMLHVASKSLKISGISFLWFECSRILSMLASYIGQQGLLHLMTQGLHKRK